MARIKNTDIYVFDIVPEPSSFLVGSDQGDGRITKSYRLEAIFSLLPDFGYITDAPSDGSPYVRQDGGWVEVPPSGVDSVYSVFGRIGAVTALEADYDDFYSLVDHTHAWSEITDKPASFTPSAHTHVTNDITNLSSYTGLDVRYFTETESDARFAPIEHTHTESDITDLGDYLESVDIGDINATGTADGTTFLRGDGVWADPNTVDSVFGRTGTVVAAEADYEDFYSLLGHTHTESDITDLGDYLESVDIGDINATGTASSGTWLRGDGTWGQIIAGVSSVFGRTLDVVATAGDYDDFYYTESEIDTLLSGKEDSFTKNTAFNKDFGTSSGTVSEGDHTHAFADLTSIPTTIAGYGITDFNSLGDARWSQLGHTHTFASLASIPTSISGYGITDAYTKTETDNKYLRKDIGDTHTGGLTLEGGYFTLNNNGGFPIIVFDDGTTERNLFTAGNVLRFRYNGVDDGTIWHSLNDGSGSGLDADLLRGVHWGNVNTDIITSEHIFLNDYKSLKLGTSSPNVNLYSSGTNIELDLVDVNFRIRNAGVGTMFTFGRTTGNLDAEGLITAEDGFNPGSGKYFHNGTSSRDKVRVWSSESFTIGMQSGFTFGSLDDYAMTFQMSNTNDRGWWWGDISHTNAQGAMSLTTDGRLSVASYTRLGYGQSDTTAAGTTYMLQVNGNIQASNFTLSSDRRKKNSITDYKVRPVDVRWKNFIYNNDDTNTLQLGVVAQDLQQTNPEFVTEEDNGDLSVNYIQMHSAILAGYETKFKEQGEEIQILKDKLELLIKELL